ncbi:MAG: exodeoxyribonuclease VII small subunit [Candidatus Zixiibacteriota bacterium]|nr:MAG: exodeoxyribonuclease VII small subunit [candidate division Zixibacteria bacterium]
MAQKGKSIQKLNFEEAMEKLEKIVENLESGELSLEDSVKSFEEGIELSKLCKKKLESAENRVKKIVERSEGDLDFELFDEPEGETNE